MQPGPTDHDSTVSASFRRIWKEDPVVGNCSSPQQITKRKDSTDIPDSDPLGSHPAMIGTPTVPVKAHANSFGGHYLDVDVVASDVSGTGQLTSFWI